MSTQTSSDQQKAKSVIQWIGDKGLEMYNSWGIEDTRDDTLLNTGEDGPLTVNHMPTHNEQDLTYGTTHHKRINQLRSTMQIFLTKARLFSRDVARRSQTDPIT